MQLEELRDDLKNARAYNKGDKGKDKDRGGRYVPVDMTNPEKTEVLGFTLIPR